MHREHADSELSGLSNRQADRIWDIVILQVQEYPSAGGNQIANNTRSFGGVKLHPDFVGENGSAHGRHYLLSGGR
jgi:hypothetical protein